MTDVYIVWDNSNIFLGGKNYCRQQEWREREFRIYFENLIDLAADQRNVEQVFCVGSVPPPTNSVWGHIEKKTGKRPELYERGAESGKEQAVDQALQTRMLRLGYDVKHPQTLVLMSGDGSGHERNEGFLSDAKRLHDRGWNIEIIAWEGSCSKVMREWAVANGVFVNLEDFYAEISFLEGGDRQVLPLDLSKRPRK